MWIIKYKQNFTMIKEGKYMGGDFLVFGQHQK